MKSALLRIWLGCPCFLSVRRDLYQKPSMGKINGKNIHNRKQSHIVKRYHLSRGRRLPALPSTPDSMLWCQNLSHLFFPFHPSTLPQVSRPNIETSGQGGCAGPPASLVSSVVACWCQTYFPINFSHRRTPIIVLARTSSSWLQVWFIFLGCSRVRLLLLLFLMWLFVT